MFRKDLLGWYAIILVSLSPLLIWASLMPLAYRFANTATTLTSIGQMLALVGVTMFSLNIVLSTRMKWFEDYFGGMNKVYIAHHIFGGTAFLILLFHPIMLAFSLAQYSPYSAAIFLLPTLDNIWIFIGKCAFYLLMTIIVITFFAKLPYQMWRFIHKFMGLAFFLASLHGFFVSSDISASPLLRTYMSTIFTMGLAAFTYKTLLGRFTKKQYRYKVDTVQQLSDHTVEITFVTRADKMSVLPGQFAFLRFASKHVSDEVHPFTIASGSGEKITLAIKDEGDYTHAVRKVQPGDSAFIEGPYGRFLFKRGTQKNQIWIAGGIGITPFVGMAQDITSEYNVHLFYTVHAEHEVVYKNIFTRLAEANTHFRFFPHISEKNGRLTTDAIKKIVGNLHEKEFYICGPISMMASLRKQLRALGVKNQHIHTEEFNLL